ncbi:MAG TPA: hypothetical protein VHD32_13405 [Candidatus Didemnitutus sp.]|nr:hypothetical protein [Candidatus Didemnitutus sp.]
MEPEAPTLAPSPLSSDFVELRTRVGKFEKSVAYCLCLVPCLFSAQCLCVAGMAPTYQVMFVDFGAKLPTPTVFVTDTWWVWAILGVVAPISTIVVALRARAFRSVIFSTVTGLVMFGVAQAITVSLFLPIIQLGSVAGGVK